VLLSRDQAQGWLVRLAGHTLAAIGPSLGGAPAALLSATAASAGLRPMLYKCTARDAALARAAGWSVIRIARAATIAPATWSTDGSARRGLRRKLKRAEKSGVRIDIDPMVLPYAAMSEVAAAWAAARGGERGFSVGQFDAAILRRERVLIAYHGEALVAFATFFWNGSDWSLDLMRQSAAAPDGTMHALVAAAIAEARMEGARSVSLSACAHPAKGHRGIEAIGRRVAQKLRGLEQFKSAFAPDWRPLYAAAPSRAALAKGLADVAFVIHRPAPLGARDPLSRLLPGQPQIPVEPKGATCDSQDQLFNRAEALMKAARYDVRDLFDDERTRQDARDPRLDPR